MEKSVILNNGIKMPLVGLGTYNFRSLDNLKNIILEGVEIGYRHIDTATFYQNEEVVGKAIKECCISREDIFITDKVWNYDQGYEKTLSSFNESIKKLKTDYLDLYLIHWPQPLSKETWRAFKKLYKEGYVRAIGVSNFTVDFLKMLIEDAEVIPAVNQIEFHPRLIQRDLIEYCKEQNIVLEAWSPLMRGDVFKSTLLKKIANKYNKTIAQIVLRWDLQMGFSTIQKSESIERLRKNIDIFDFEISEDDMELIEKLNDGFRIGTDPDKVYYHPEIILD